jgi:hypothetical protein
MKSQLALGPEAVRGLHNAQQHGRPDVRRDRGVSGSIYR